MTTLIGGAYTGCPFKSLPTGYMVWAIEKEVFKKQWREIHNELTYRLGLFKMGQQPEPKWNSGYEHESWYQAWEVPAQLRYVSMLTTDKGYWWDSTVPKHGHAQDRLNTVLAMLNNLYPDQKQVSTFDDLFNDDELFYIDDVNELGPGETEDDMTMEEVIEMLEGKKPDLKEILKPQPKVTADDIIHLIRSRNSANQHELAYQSVLNELESVTKLIAEQQNHFDMWEMRDISWHLEMVHNRMYWLLRQREDHAE
jgi:hypothetical protein